MTRAPAIIGIGGAHVDRIGHVQGAFRPGVSNPGVMAEWVGGCMANTLRVAKALGAAHMELISARGGDAAGAMVAAALAEAGIADHSAVFLDRATPSYTAIMNEDGDVMAALADMALYDRGLARHLRRAEPRALISAADAVAVDANLPETAIGTVIAAANGLVAALAVSPAKAERLKPHARQIALVMMNRRECNTLIGADAQEPVTPEALAKLRMLGFASAVISDGTGPVTVMDGDTALRQPVPDGVAPVDVTGAGDALAGAVIAHWPKLPLGEAVRTGIAAASATIATPGPFRSDLSACDLTGMAAALPPAEPIPLRATPGKDVHAATSL